MDDSEIAQAIVELALPQMDLRKLIGTDFSVADAEALGRKFGTFYQGFYRGVLASIIDGKQMLQMDEAKLEDVVHTKGGGVRAAAKVKVKAASGIKQAKLNDVVSSKGLISRKSP
jgi:hypothetical protein